MSPDAEPDPLRVAVGLAIRRARRDSGWTVVGDDPIRLLLVVVRPEAAAPR